MAGAACRRDSWCEFTKKAPSTPRCLGVERVGRGYAQTDPHLNREPGFFVLAVAEFFTFREDWHQDDRAQPLVRQYQLTLDAVLRHRADLADCAVTCCHCQIRFLTHRRNAGRQDLRCPFGCRRHHRRQCANARSRKHYATADGKRNKKRHNGKRSQCAAGADVSPHDHQAPSPSCEPLPLEESLDMASVNPSGVETEESLDMASVNPSAGETENAPESSGLREEAAANLTWPPPACAWHADRPAELLWEGLLIDEATLRNSPVLPYVLMLASLLQRRTIGREELVAALRRSMRQRSIGRWPHREYVLRYLHEHPP